MNRYNKIVFAALIIISGSADAQTLVKKHLSQSERDSGIVEKYIHEGPEEGAYLLLYASGRYRYNEFNLVMSHFSEGIWKRETGILALSSTYGAYRLPISVQYVDTPSRTGFRFVYNSVGQVVENALIAVNDDSLICLTMVDTCVGKPGRIKRIKVIINEKNFYSKWLAVDPPEHKTINVIIPSPVDFDHYVAFNGKRYRLVKGRLVGLR